MVWITTPNIAEEAWHQLLALANEELAIERLTAIHGAKYSQKNYKKQARQIRVSLLQAREYFRAAAESTLYTSPNHMYYGMVALASALMLLWGDGTKSLDYLRADTKNRSHGLRFSIGITASNASQGLNILTSSCVEVLRHGHFMNWYETLPDVWPIFGLIINHLEPGRTTTSRQQQGSEKLLKASEIAGLKKPLLT